MRGKFAARAANSRAEEAETVARKLEQEIADLRSRHKEEVDALKGRILSLQNRLNRDVQRLSKEAIEAAQEESKASADLSIATLKAAQISAARLLWDAWQTTDLVNIDPLVYGEFLKRAGVDYRDLKVGDPDDGSPFSTRYQRLVNSTEYAKNVARITEIEGDEPGVAEQRRRLGIASPDSGSRMPGQLTLGPS